MKSLWSAAESLCLLYVIPVIVVVRQAKRWGRGDEIIATEANVVAVLSATFAGMVY
jgi:hypothetical protein